MKLKLLVFRLRRFLKRVRPAPKENIRRMQEFLSALPATEREALARFYGQGQMTETICRDLGLSPGELAALRQRAREHFRTRPDPALVREVSR